MDAGYSSPRPPMIPARLLFLLSAALLSTAFGAEPSRVDSSTLNGKVMVGYQGWFNAEGDGAGRGYNHWTRGNVKPAAGKVRIDTLRGQLQPPQTMACVLEICARCAARVHVPAPVDFRHLNPR